MTSSKLILTLAAMSCLLRSVPAQSQEPPGDDGHKAGVAEAEFDVRMRERELQMAELSVEEGLIELDKVKLHLEAAQERGDMREAGLAKLDLKQAAIRVEMRRVEAGMIRIQVERARIGLERQQAARQKTTKQDSRGEGEYQDNADRFKSRGAKKDVAKTKAQRKDAEKTLTYAHAKLAIAVFSIANGNAAELVDELRALFPEKARPLYLACDHRTNSVMARGTPDELEEVEAILVRLDGE